MPQATTCQRQEACLFAGQHPTPESLPKLRDALADPEWRVRYAAIIALGELADPAAEPLLLELLRHEDSQPLYSQDDDYGGFFAGADTAAAAQLPPGTTPDTAAAWQRRGRLKQAACYALAQTGVQHPETIAQLAKYAADIEEDYPVRAAACATLRQVPPELVDQAALEALRNAAAYNEFCTACEARKSLTALGAD